MKSGRCINENVLEWAYKKRLIGLPPKKPPHQKEMEKAQPRIAPVTPSESVGQRQRPRRPDKQLYVPRARRGDASSGDEATQSDEKIHLSASQTAKTTPKISDQKVLNCTVHLKTVENSKPVQENPSRRTIEFLNRTLQNDVPKNLPDVVPVERKKIPSVAANKNDPIERNILQKSTADDNSRVNCSRKSSASDCKPCDLVSGPRERNILQKSMPGDNSRVNFSRQSSASDCKPCDLVNDPRERNNLQKSTPGDNSRVNYPRKSSASDCKPCDLVNVKTNDQKPVERITSVRSTITHKEAVPICTKNLQKSSLSIKPNNVSHVTQARKSSICDNDETKSRAESKGPVESVPSLRAASKSNISERKNVQKSLSSMKISDKIKSSVEQTRKLSLSTCNQKASRSSVEQITSGKESVDSIPSVENVSTSKTKDVCERVSVQISPTTVKSNDNNHACTQNSYLNSDKAHTFHLVPVNAEDEDFNGSVSSIRARSKHKHPENQKNEQIFIENSDIIHDESSQSDRKPSEWPLDEIRGDAKVSVDVLYLNHEIEANISENKGNQESTVHSESNDNLNLQSLNETSLPEIPVKEVEMNADLGNRQLCKNDMKLSCSPFSITLEVECLQKTFAVVEEECNLLETLGDADVKEACGISTIITDTCSSHADNLLHVLVQDSFSGNTYVIPSQDTSAKVNVVHESQLVEINKDIEELSQSYSLENLQTTTEKEISVIVEKNLNSSPVHDNHVESSFLFKPIIHNELEDDEEFHTSESVIPVGQHFDEDILHVEDNLDQTKTEEDSWDSLFDENGDCLNPTVMTELTDTLGKVDIQKSKYDYLEFRPQDPDLSGEEFSHIVELYDFPAEFKTQDLMSTLSTFRERGFNIKWIDDTHALAVFSSSIAATEALSIQHPLVKVRPLSQAISGSKWKAKRFSDDLLPYKPRPQTTASLARRLVSGALGLRVSISKEQRDQERQRLQQAKERKRQVAKQKQDVWDGAVK